MKDLEDRGVIETLENGSVVIKERAAERLSHRGATLSQCSALPPNCRKR